MMLDIERWRHIVCWRDRVAVWRGFGALPRTYALTAERRRRIESVLTGAIVPAHDGQSWLWSWNDWNWREL